MDGPWSPVSVSRKEIVIVAVTPETPPALTAEDWTALESFEIGGLVTAAFGLGGPAAAAVAVDWTAGAPAAADWQPCVALGAGRWRLDGPGSAIAAGVLSVAVRYRLAAGPASPASGRKTLTVVEPLPRLPLLVAAPALAGSGKIGQPVTLTPGLWSDPAAALAIEWRRNGVALSGATGTAYVPQPADDMTELSVRVTATNAAGNLAVVTAALPITYVAPEAVGVLPEEVFDEGTGPQEVPAKGAFRGENLSFAADGAGASVDSEGVVSIPTDVPLSDTVTVTATNSGGSATQSFAVTVEPAEDALPPGLGPADWSVAELVEDPDHPGMFTAVLEMAAAGPAGAAAEVFWTNWPT